MSTTVISGVKTARKTEYEVDPLFPSRWSPRAFSGEPIAQDQLMRLFEAARWAPSSYNNQPWRFVYGRQGTPAWDTLFALLNEHNQSWAGQAAALLVIASKRTFENGKTCRTHSFDAGSAWMSLALQAWMDGWVAHGMEGFDYDRAQQTLRLGDDYAIEAMAAIGRPGSKEKLRKALQAKEFPSDRKPLREIASEAA